MKPTTNDALQLWHQTLRPIYREVLEQLSPENAIAGDLAKLYERAERALEEVPPPEQVESALWQLYLAASAIVPVLPSAAANVVRRVVRVVRGALELLRAQSGLTPVSVVIRPTKAGAPPASIEDEID